MRERNEHPVEEVLRGAPGDRVEYVVEPWPEVEVPSPERLKRALASLREATGDPGASFFWSPAAVWYGPVRTFDLRRAWAAKARGPLSNRARPIAYGATLEEAVERAADYARAWRR